MCALLGRGPAGGVVVWGRIPCASQPWAVIVLSPGALGSIIERPALDHYRYHLQPGLIQAKRALCADGVQIGLAIKDGREAFEVWFAQLCVAGMRKV
jgi:hypothetical protein